MSDLNEVGWNRNEFEAVESLLATKGFTSRDMRLLQEAQKSRVNGRGWGRSQFFTTDFSQYLAIWDSESTDQTSPSLSIVRFDKTGTYALLMAGQFIATGKTLDVILPTLAVAGSLTGEK